MIAAGHRKPTIAFFIALGACAAAAAVALNVGWVLISWRTGVLLVFGSIFFSLIITGVVLNTIFLVREIRRNEQHDAFINAVTHELKTPVASIRLYLQTLQSRNLDEAKRAEFYRVMLEDSDRLLVTIEQVLRASRSATRRKPLHREPVDFRAVALESAELARVRHHLPETALRFSDAMEGREAMVIGDVDDLKAAVINLIENAIKYSAGHIDVTVELVRTGDEVAVRVRDQGVGIPAHELKRIWRRFYRIPGAVAARVKGTGLGLFIVRSIAEKHGGRAYAESEGTGRGSTFTLELPVAQRR